MSFKVPLEGGLRQSALREGATQIGCPGSRLSLQGPVGRKMDPRLGTRMTYSACTQGDGTGF